MARAQEEFSSLRFGRRESERVIVALLISVLVHLAVVGGYYAGNKLGVWQKFHVPAWLRLPLAKKKYGLQALVAHNTQPTIFVDVSQADADAPAQTRFYSNKNAHAANPDTANANIPRITGSQTDFPKTENVPKLSKAAESAPKDTPKETPKTDSTPQHSQLEPTMAPPAPRPAETMEPPSSPGDLEPRPKNNAAQQEKPRTLRQALAQRDHLPGPAVQQAGGVPHRAAASFDVKATAFGDYDSALIMAVQQRWDDLLDNHRYADDRQGKVILRFKLKPDGTVIEMQTMENNVGELLGYLCQEAIEEAAPFAKWPSDMAREVDANYRVITFTFYYY
jgi:hypothetical protein